MDRISWTADYKNRGLFLFGGTIETNCSSEKLWELLSSKGHLLIVHPFCQNHVSEEWIGIGSKDVVNYNDGGKRNRTVTKWIPSQLLELNVENPINKEITKATYTIIKIKGNENCVLQIQMRTDTYKNIPRPFWKIYAKQILLPRYKKYLEGVLIGFANYQPPTL